MCLDGRTEELMSIYSCPCCGEKTFNPLTKALAGQLNSKGKVCSNCGKHCTNGTASTIFRAVFCTAMFALVVITFLKALPHELLIYIGALAAMYIVPMLINAFCFKMEPTRRKDAAS